MEFDKTKHIEKIQPAFQKLLISLKKKGIDFQPTDGEMNNAIFIKDGKQIKICHHWLYRISGIASIYKSDRKNENFLIPVLVTDDMFAEPIIETLFEKFEL